MQEVGFTGTLAAFDQSLADAPQQHFRDREEMVDYCRVIAQKAEPELPRFFKRLPRMPFGIRAIPADREASTASNYTGPATDGSRAGWFNLNAYQPEKQVRYNKAALTLHEGVPGHHLQIALQREMEGLPEFRKLYGNTAYLEGWALYAESLGDEMGVYPDPYSRFGKLSSERFRAVRLVVDTGIHAKGWSKQRAVDYMLANTAQSRTEAESEINRYIANPGQSLAYKIGQLKIRELRTRAEQALGPKFDVRDFHAQVLMSGALPLAVLEAKIDRWIAHARRPEA
jgi:prolyl oligopeptidase